MLNISARLNLNTSGFSAGLNNASRTARMFASATSSSFSGIGAKAKSIGSAMAGVSRDSMQSMQKSTDKAKEALNSTSGALKSFGSSIRNSLNNGFVEPANKAKIKWKDVARIIQGILISRIFYDGLRSINAATSAVWQFATELEKTKIAFDNLFGDTALTDRFIAVLKDAAINNALFDFSAMEDASKRLLAYGIDYSNLMYVMNGVMSAASVTGDATKVESISRALGQIYTKGRLMGQEVLQLTEAGVPVYDILNKKLGITEKEMANIADQGITATNAINALVDGLTEKYGSVLTASKYTMTGMINNVKDVLLMLGERAIQPVFNFTKAVLYQMQQALEAAYKAMKERGLGAAFESLIPKAAQETIRTLIAAFSNLGLSLAKIGLLFKELSKSILPGLAYGFTLVVNVMAPILNTFTDMLRLLAQNRAAMASLTVAATVAAAAFLALKVRALGLLVLTGVTKVIEGVAKSLAILTALASSASRTLIVLIGLALALATGFAAATGTLEGFLRKLASLSGYTSADILIPGEGTGSGDIDEFNNKLEGTADAYEDVADAAGAAKKAADKYKAGLLSFDEVFKLNEPNDPSGSGGGGGAGDEDLSVPTLGVGGFGTDAIIPDMPSFSDFATNFINGISSTLLGKLGAAGIAGMLAAKLTKELGDLDFSKLTKGSAKFAEKFAGALGLALRGSLIGLATGSLLSIFTDSLWQKLEELFSLSETADKQARLGAAIGSAIGGAIGLAVGGMPGSIIGASIGHLAGGLVGLLSEKVVSAVNTITAPFVAMGMAISKALGGSLLAAFKNIANTIATQGLKAAFASIGTAIKQVGLKTIAKGGLIGAAIGFVVDMLAGALWNTLIEKFSLGEGAKETAAFGQTVGSLLGTVIGALLGGPAGALIGSGIGTFVGGFIGLFWEKIKNGVSSLTNGLSDLIGKWLKDSLVAFGGWFKETLVGFFEWSSSTLSGFSDWFGATLSGLLSWVGDTFDGFMQWWSDTIALFSDWDSITKDTLINWLSSTASSFFGWIFDTLNAFDGWTRDTAARLGSWVGNTLRSFASWATNALAAFGGWVFDSIRSLESWAADTIATFGRWVGDVLGKLGAWASEALTKVTSGLNSLLKAIGGFAIAVVLSFGGWIEEVLGKLGTFAKELPKKCAEALDKALKAFKDWVNDIWTSVFGPLGNWISDALNKLARLKNGSTTSGLISGAVTSVFGALPGHATGGVFTREHIARFAEGNKAEMVVPLQNASAMQPFVDALSQGILEGIAPAMMTSGATSEMPPLYVGTLIADDRGLKQLYRKFEVIQLQENARRGIPAL